MQAQFVLQQRDVGHRDLAHGDFDLARGFHAATARRLHVQRVDSHATAEQLRQALDLGALLVLGAPAVLRVHVEDQIDGRAGLDDSAQQESGEEALARA